VDPELGLVLQVLQQLAGQGASEPRSGRYPPKLLTVHERVAATHVAVDDSQFASLLRDKPANFNLTDTDRFVFLRADKETGWGLPVLTFSFDQDHKPTRLGLRVAVFVAGDDRYAPAASGFRLEGPEGDGNHNYYHAQWIVSFVKGGQPLPCPVWIPTSYPALPIAASGPASLLFALLLALYGMKSSVIADLLRTPSTRALKNYMTDIPGMTRSEGR
jgi:hypothetical protein